MSSIEKEILFWFENNERDLPWRKTTPWGVMVSEFMLQQTPVSRVLPKWNEWMERWPTPADLAAASTADVITAWGRLGYPRRCLRLHESSKVIAADFNNEVPKDENVLRTLPGVGEYTAAAIAAFAYQEPSLVLDVNIRRVFGRVFDGVQYPIGTPTNAERAHRRELIPTEDAHVWAAATMELGALVCTSRSPQCHECPVMNFCKWRAKGFPESVQIRKTQTWHGTDRQCRGTILQALRESPSLSELSLKQIWHDDSQVERALNGLLKDGLIWINAETHYALPAM